MRANMIIPNKTRNREKEKKTQSHNGTMRGNGSVIGYSA